MFPETITFQMQTLYVCLTLRTRHIQVVGMSDPSVTAQLAVCASQPGACSQWLDNL